MYFYIFNYNFMSVLSFFEYYHDYCYNETLLFINNYRFIYKYKLVWYLRNFYINIDTVSILFNVSSVRFIQNFACI